MWFINPNIPVRPTFFAKVMSENATAARICQNSGEYAEAARLWNEAGNAAANAGMNTYGHERAYYLTVLAEQRRLADECAQNQRIQDNQKEMNAMEANIFTNVVLGVNCAGCGAGRDAEQITKEEFAQSLLADGWTLAANGRALCSGCDAATEVWG